MKLHAKTHLVLEGAEGGGGLAGLGGGEGGGAGEEGGKDGGLHGWIRFEIRQEKVTEAAWLGSRYELEEQAGRWIGKL